MTDVIGKQLYFMHVPKTAGTTLRLMLEEVFEKDEIFPNNQLIKSEPRVYNQSKPFREHFEKLEKKPLLIRAHVPFWEIEDLIDEDAFKLTVLRDPLSRTISEILHHSRHRDVPKREFSVGGITRIISEILHHDQKDNRSIQKLSVDKIIFERKDLYQRGFGLGYYFGENEADALENLKKFDLVGLQEQFNSSLKMLSSVLRINTLDKNNKKSNSNVHDPCDEKVSIEGLYELQKTIKRDYLIYNFACYRFEECKRKFSN